MRTTVRTLLIYLVGLINIASTLLPIWPKRYLILTSLFPIRLVLAAQHLPRAVNVIDSPPPIPGTVVILGGSSGIGLATAKAALAEQASVVITGRSRERLEAAASRGEVEPLHGDFPAFGRPYGKIGRQELKLALRIADARMHALTWLTQPGTSW